jgi:hypothetical protein
MMQISAYIFEIGGHSFVKKDGCGVSVANRAISSFLYKIIIFNDQFNIFIPLRTNSLTFVWERMKEGMNE